MLELKNEYSMTKTINGITEFEHRKSKMWEEFKNNFNGLELLNEFHRKKHDKHEDEKIIYDLISKGDIIQTQLTRSINSFETYKDYIKSMLFNISLQNDVIRDMNNFIKESVEYYTSLKETKKNIDKMSRKFDKEIKKERG